MGKVLIISTSYSEQEKIEQVYRHHKSGQFSFETTSSFGQDASWWTLHPPEALIMVLPEDDQLRHYFFEKLRKDVPKSMRVMFLTPTVTSPLMQVSTRFERIRIVKTPANGFSLYKGLVDLTTNFPVGRLQVHPRYLTDQGVGVFSDSRNKRGAGKMRNLSVGGMYFELPEVVPTFKTGELLRVSVEIKDMRTYQFDVKVVWCKATDDQLSTGYGCAFLSRDQVFDTLLSGVSS